MRQTVFGKRERRLLSETVQVEEELIPAFVRPILYVVAAMVISFIGWAGLTDLTEVATAPGEVVPAGNIKVVQHLDGGVVDAINVEDRMLVEKGQVLLRIDGSQAHADQRQMEARLASLKLRAERLAAFTEERKPDFSAYAEQYPDLVSDQRGLYLNQMATRTSTLDILDRQVDQRKRRLAQLDESLAAAREQQGLTAEMVAMREGLAARKLIDRTTLLETRRAEVTAQGEVNRIVQEIDLVNQELAEAESRRIDSANQLRRDALAEMGTVRAEIAEVEETLRRLDARVNRLEVRAPTRGYVHNLKVQTVGQVVQPGSLLMQIVPAAAALEAEVRIAPKDVGYVKVGQEVNLRVSSYDYSRFGFATGILKRISASNVVGDDGRPYFLGWVALDKPYVGDDPSRHPLQAGMAVEAEILTGHKTLLAYLSKPVVNALSSAFRER
ncbi:HlyD family type I secretion periplasmic adaptor subunit [Endothiovibrio diazotrophicus]